MNLFDVVVLLLLVFAAFRGKATGLVRQIISCVALVLGVWLSWKIGPAVGSMFVEDEKLAVLVGFIVVFVLVVVALGVAGFLVKGVFRIAGLGVLDSWLGLAISVIKFWAVASVLCYWASELPEAQKTIEEDVRPKSLLYNPMIESAEFIFPYVDFAKEYISEADISVEAIEGLIPKDSSQAVEKSVEEE